jgi:tetratricopeptide (TPR) repeat protein
MLKPKKKITKKDIKEDKLVSTYFEATKWYEEHKKVVSSVVTGLVIVIIAAIVIRNNIVSSNEQATTELSKILKYYDQGNYEAAINGIPQENVRGLLAVVNEYGSTHAGEFAKFYLANSYYALGNYDKALEYYLEVDLKDDLLQASAYAGAASCYENKGNHSSAASYYEKAAMRGKENVQAAEQLQRAALNYAAAGNRGKAVELLKKIKKDFPTSSVAREVDRYMASINS